jgi:hypothetical protein
MWNNQIITGYIDTCIFRGYSEAEIIDCVRFSSHPSIGCSSGLQVFEGYPLRKLAIANIDLKINVSFG